MNRFDLKSTTPQEMLNHISTAQMNATALAANGDFMGALGRAMESSDLVYAVWPETDRRKQRLLDHALAVIKGIPSMQAHYIAGTDMKAKILYVMFASHRTACEACKLFGDDRQQAA